MLTVDMRCTRCTKTFPVALDVFRSLNYDTLPKRCPTCQDEIQSRPDVVLERTTIDEFTCRIDSSFATFFASATEFRPLPTDTPSRRLTVKGSEFGVSWSGRIDLFSHVWPVTSDMVVVLSHNAVRRKVWYVERERHVGSMMFDCRRVTTTRRVPQNYVPQTYVLAGREEIEKVGQREETNEYVLLTQSLDSTAKALQRDALLRLVWATAYSKTTLKGFGRQFSNRIEGKPLWSLSVSGGCRSGRYDTHAMLAVVDPMSPLKIVGGIEESGNVRRVPSSDFVPSSTEEVVTSYGRSVVE